MSMHHQDGQIQSEQKAKTEQRGLQCYKAVGRN